MAANRPDLSVTNYDPAVDEFNIAPEPAELVVCTDVIPLVGIDYLEPVLDDIDRCTVRALFIVIPMYGPDRAANYHSDLIIWPEEDWRALMLKRWQGGRFCRSRVGGTRLQFTYVRP